MISVKILKKLKSRRGETISETLVATLIAALSMVLFGSMVVASNNIIKDSRSDMENYYKWTSNMMDSKSSGSGAVEMESATISFTVPPVDKNNKDVTLFYNQSSGDSKENEIPVKCY